MRRALLLLSIFTLASCGAGETQMAEKNVAVAVQPTDDGACLVADAQIKSLREEFTTSAKALPLAIKSRSEQKRNPLEYPFVEPPEITFTLYHNPEGLDYGWTVEVIEDCIRNGSKLDNIQFEMTFRDGGRTTTNTANINQSNKL